MSENPFLALVAEALASGGRDVEVDAALNTIDVTSADPVIGQVLAVVRPIARAVTFYVVHPTLVPEAQYVDVADLLVHAAPDLLDTSLELEQGAVAFRIPVLLGALVLDVDDLGLLLLAAVETVEATAARYRDALDAVITGEIDATVAVAQARRAPLEELEAELDELEGRS